MKQSNRADELLAQAVLSEGPDRTILLVQATEYYQTALQIYTHEASPSEWGKVQHTQALAYYLLGIQDREKGFLEKAIEYFKTALQVYTREASPEKWAEIQQQLGEICQRLSQD